MTNRAQNQIGCASDGASAAAMQSTAIDLRNLGKLAHFCEHMPGFKPVHTETGPCVFEFPDASRVPAFWANGTSLGERN